MRFGCFPDRIAILLVQVGLGLGVLALAGCATEPRTCYETVELPEYGHLLRPIPCPAADEQ